MKLSRVFYLTLTGHGNQSPAENARQDFNDSVWVLTNPKQGIPGCPYLTVKAMIKDFEPKYSHERKKK